MRDENDIISEQDFKENKKLDSVQKLMQQARRHKVKESRLNAKEVNLGEPELDIEWHAAPYLKKCYCPAEPCVCQSHLLKAGYLPQRTHYINKDHLDKEPPRTLVPRLAAAVKAEIEISKQLKTKLEQRGPEFCASNCKAFLHPVKEGGYHIERKKLIEKYIKENCLEKKMKHYIKIREGKCLQQIQNRKKLEEKVCLKNRPEKKASEEGNVAEENEDVDEDEFEEKDCASGSANIGAYTKLGNTTDTYTSPQSEEQMLAHREAEYKNTRSNHSCAGYENPTKDSETEPVDFKTDDCRCHKPDYGKRTEKCELDIKGPVGRKHYSVI